MKIITCPGHSQYLLLNLSIVFFASDRALEMKTIGRQSPLSGCGQLRTAPRQKDDASADTRVSAWGEYTARTCGELSSAFSF